MQNPANGGRFYLIDGEHVPADEVEVPSDPYNLRAICGDMWPDITAEINTDSKE